MHSWFSQWYQGSINHWYGTNGAISGTTGIGNTDGIDGKIEDIFGRTLRARSVNGTCDKNHAKLSSMQRTGENIILTLVIEHAKF